VDSNLLPMPATQDIHLMDILRALADPGRLHMLTVLADGAYHPCKREEFGLDVQKSTLSYHFKTLREAGLTVTRVQGRNYDMRLRRADLDDRFPGLIDALIAANASEDRDTSP